MSKTVLYRSTTATKKGANNYGTQLRNHIRESVKGNEAVTHLSVKIGWLLSWTF